MKFTNDYLHAYNGQMTKGAAIAFKQECMATLYWSSSTFYRKISSGQFRNPVEEKAFINIFYKYINK